MWSSIQRVCGLFLAVAAVAAGVVLLREAAAGTGALEAAFLRWSDSGPRLVGMAAVALIVLGGGYVWTGWAQRLERVLAYDNEGGTVSIRTEAIRAFIAKLAPEFPSVLRLYPDVKVGRRGIRVRVGVRLQAGDVHETCELLQQRVRERLVTELGIAQIHSVDVRVREIVGEDQA